MSSLIQLQAAMSEAKYYLRQASAAGSLAAARKAAGAVINCAHNSIPAPEGLDMDKCVSQGITPEIAAAAASLYYMSHQAASLARVRAREQVALRDQFAELVASNMETIRDQDRATARAWSAIADELAGLV